MRDESDGPWLVDTILTCAPDSPFQHLNVLPDSAWVSNRSLLAAIRPEKLGCSALAAIRGTKSA